jgi:putative oxidoreductase
MALAAGLAELGGGLLLALGLLTPLAALAIAVVMLNALASVHWRNGFWNTNGGYEFTLLIWAAAIALAATGPGRFSFDAPSRFGVRLSHRVSGSRSDSARACSAESRSRSRS